MASGARQAGIQTSLFFTFFGLDAENPVDLARVAAWLQGVGFEAERPFTRMVRGGAPPGDAARLVLMAGPELG